jgi:predicted nucleotidyltransferase
MSTKDQFMGLIERQWGDLRERFAVRRIGLFGSCARDEARDDSDLDVLVEFDRKTFDNYMGLKLFLEDSLGREVDLVIAENIKPLLRKYILAEVAYAAGP